MLLNIYLISHPIIKLLSKSFISTQINETQNNYKYKYISLFLFYEMMRKYLQIKIIYVKKVSYIETFYLLESNKEYYIITNLLNTYNAIGEIKILMPNITILNINSQAQLLYRDIKGINKSTNKMKRIIILENILDQQSIIELITILIKENNIYIENIHIICITCYNQILDKLGKKYPKLNIYTTQII
uniref:Uracil phosphoribosyltransferase n=1 Tax=Cumathamnion serrulatum TaxID=1206573 RepID=A0A7U1G3U5_9FLOR|nr:uracil phosphoribosyltransferase [Cumathamnion serrulatum]QQY85326.1 uracil phosphoribosyltransferase [Cumathamnion serrulatum]